MIIKNTSKHCDRDNNNNNNNNTNNNSKVGLGEPSSLPPQFIRGILSNKDGDDYENVT